MTRMVCRMGIGVVLVLGLAAQSVQAAAPEVQIARDGRAAQPVVVSDKASERVRATADLLAGYLGQIASAPFEVKSGDGAAGIAVGLAGDFPATAKAFDGQAPNPDRYLLRSHASGLHVIGATEQAVEHAAWDLLYRLGHRQFFPAPEWEVVPQQKDLKLAVDVVEQPDYQARRIWFTYGTWPENKEMMATWSARNRMAGEFDLNSGHAYGNIIGKNKAAFDQHPEYYAMVGGQRNVKPQAKLCISNPGLRQIVVDHCLKFFDENPDSETVSVDPSDGGGWCECEACAAIGTPSDLALTLANAVAEAVEAKYPGEDKYVAMYAYNMHSAPPSITAHPRVIVNVATAFIKGGQNVEAIIQGWKDKGIRQFGIREYYSIIHWDQDLPNGGRGSRLDYLTRTIPTFHGMGARYMSAESSDNWGPNGLGYYVASRMLWDVDEAGRVDALVADFLDKAFGSAREPMAKLYQMLNGDQPTKLSEHQVGKMYRLVDEAMKLSDDPQVQARIGHLALYTRYVDLYRQYQMASGEARQAAYEAVIRHSYRIHDTGMVHSLAQYRTGFRDKSVKTPTEATWKTPEESNTWKSDPAYTAAEIRQIVQQGVAQNQLRAFDDVAFSQQLVPAAGPLNLSGKSFNPDRKHGGRGTWYFYTWIPEPGYKLELTVTGGLISHYRDRGPAKVELQEWDEEDAEYKTVDRGETAPDGVARQITLTAKSAGRHRVTLADGKDKTDLQWPAGIPWTVENSMDVANHLVDRHSVYFYVPKGTKMVGGYAEKGLAGAMYDAEGNKVMSFEDAGEVEGFVHAPVPPGQDGKLWTLRNMAGAFQLMTVPPFVAPEPGALLLPQEIVERDK